MTGNGHPESSTARSAWFCFSAKENELWNAQSSTSHWVRGERYQYFGARYYDPVACSWTGEDPLAEKYYGISPYTYCAGNPVNLIDSEGRDWYTNNMTGYYTWFDGNDDHEGYTYFGTKGSVLGEEEYTPSVIPSAGLDLDYDPFANMSSGPDLPGGTATHKYTRSVITKQADLAKEFYF